MKRKDEKSCCLNGLPETLTATFCNAPAVLCCGGTAEATLTDGFGHVIDRFTIHLKAGKTWQEQANQAIREHYGRDGR